MTAVAKVDAPCARLANTRSIPLYSRQAPRILSASTAQPAVNVPKQKNNLQLQ